MRNTDKNGIEERPFRDVRTRSGREAIENIFFWVGFASVRVSRIRVLAVTTLSVFICGTRSGVIQLVY